MPDDALPLNSGSILAGNRRVIVDPETGEVRAAFVVPNDRAWGRQILPRGGGYVAYPPGGGFVPGSNPYSAIRLQPPGTGAGHPDSPYASRYPNGYYIVYNAAGQPISIYTGAPDSRAYTHNPIGQVSYSPF